MPVLGEEIGAGLVGRTGMARLTVSAEDTAESLGSGDLPVFATPRMIALMEQAACRALDGILPDGVTTVGVHVDVRHTAPSAIGAVIEATARVITANGDRLAFEVEAFEQRDRERIGSGTHLRVAVDAAGFLARLDAER